MEAPILIHIDMKGGPPTVPYLLSLLPLLRSWGATGILVEWEDMFPWSSPLQMLARDGAYSRDNVQAILSAAAHHGVEVVPLIQTFGHLEFLLKHPEWRHLREMEDFPNSMRPFDNEGLGSEGLSVVGEMLKQVVEVHGEGCKRVHLGCDEVWCLGQGAVTQAVMEARGWSVTEIFLRHVARVANVTKELAPRLQLMVWDDMMRSAGVEQIKNCGLDKLVSPVIWNYGPSPCFPPGMLERYREVWGADQWVGTAWRGASGSCAISTPINHHVANHLGWLELDLPVAGWVLTGWARYDHFATLCELLPCGLPSLRCCLEVLSTKSWTEQDISSCSRSLGMSLTEPSLDSPPPSFSGSVVFCLIQTYLLLDCQYRGLMAGPARTTWFNHWQIARGHLNPLQVRSSVAALGKLGEDLKRLGVALRMEISPVLHQFTAEEWVETNIGGKVAEIEQLLRSISQKMPLMSIASDVKSNQEIGVD